MDNETQNLTRLAIFLSKYDISISTAIDMMTKWMKYVSKRREIARRYYESNKDKIDKYHKQYRQKNPEYRHKRAEKSKEYYRKHK